MNRENKRKQYEKGYYKTHPCDESFTCRNCGYVNISHFIKTFKQFSGTTPSNYSDGFRQPDADGD